MENLRKVEFTVEQQDMNLGDYDCFDDNPDEKAEETLKKREGYYLGLGNELYYNPDSQRQESKIVAIVEEEGTGKVYHVIPKFMRFKTPL